MEENKKELVTLGSELVRRLELANSLGMQTYDGERDLFQILGYPQNLKYQDYYVRYKRQDLASAIIDRPVIATWRGEIRISEPTSNEDTKLEKAFAELSKTIQLRDNFKRVDTLTSLGEYGVLLLGLDDVREIEDFAKPVQSGERKLLYVKPYGQISAIIHTTEDNPNSERYGKPLLYSITVEDYTNGRGYTVSQSGATILVHYSRIVHIVQGALESDIIGTPVLEAVFNTLINIEKISGGDAEMYWRGARPGYQGKIDKDYTMTPETKKDLEDQLDEYEHNLRRVLVNDGVDFKALSQQISDPSTHMDVQIQLISAKTSIPKRILTGSESGELSSSQDRDTWDTFISSRRGDYAETHIVKKFINHCIEFNILPASIEDDYSIVWEDLFSPSEKSKAEVGKIRANALREYATMPSAETIVPPSAFMEFFLGLNDEQINRVMQMKEEEVNLEVETALTPEEEALQQQQLEEEALQQQQLEEENNSN